MLPILFSDTGATSQDGSHSAIFRMQGPEGCGCGWVEGAVEGNLELSQPGWGMGHQVTSVFFFPQKQGQSSM